MRPVFGLGLVSGKLEGENADERETVHVLLGIGAFDSMLWWMQSTVRDEVGSCLAWMGACSVTVGSKL